MSDFLASLREFVGNRGAPEPARDPVNQPMIRHWCDAMEDAIVVPGNSDIHTFVYRVNVTSGAEYCAKVSASSSAGTGSASPAGCVTGGVTFMCAVSHGPASRRPF